MYHARLTPLKNGLVSKTQKCFFAWSKRSFNDIWQVHMHPIFVFFLVRGGGGGGGGGGGQQEKELFYFIYSIYIMYSYLNYEK